MHVLTKILVVLAAILAVLLSGLAIAYSSNHSMVVADNERLRAQAATEEAYSQSVTSQTVTINKRWQQQVDDKDAELNMLRSEISRLQSENTSYRIDNRRLELAVDQYTSRVDQFVALQENYVELDSVRNEELAELRRREQTALQNEIDLLDRLNDLDGQLDVATETNRTLQEQLAALREELARGGTGSIASRSGSLTRPAPANFRSRVTAVTKDVNGENLVAFAAGSADGLQENMRLIVVRVGRFLANLVVEIVNINDAVGRANTLGRDNVIIQPGDMIRSANG